MWKSKRLLIGVTLGLLSILGCYLLLNRLFFPNVYYAKDFGIKVVISETDYNNNGIDDYTDILLGAKMDAKNKPKYKSQYYAGGYPPENEGVCTDLVWRALLNAGYSLKDLVDADIAANIEEYPRVNSKPDTNIDFRRVPNLKVFFERNVTSLTLDPNKIEEWQPGDIVVYETKHIAIISDKRNKNGVPYILHNGGQRKREEDALTNLEISGHYRFDYKN